MEKAANAFVSKYITLFGKDRPVKIFCGVGNNGGDGLAIGRLLKERYYRNIQVFVIGKPEKGSPDFSSNYSLLEKAPVLIEDEQDLPLISDHEVIIDGIFGSGLSRPAEGLYGQLIEHINESGADIVAIDVASGLYDEKVPDGPCVNAAHTITFQVPKLSFFQPGLQQYVGQLHIVDIGLDRDFIQNQSSAHFLSEPGDFYGLIRPRSQFLHKGGAGRMMLIAGGEGKIGAAILAARACLRAGCGLLTVAMPTIGQQALHAAVPEAMAVSSGDHELSDKVYVPSNITVVGIGPGLGTSKVVTKALEVTLKELHGNLQLVLDADALNIISENKELLDLLPGGTILTPHPGEFERLVGSWTDDFDKLAKMKAFCQKHEVSMVLKGAYSVVCSEDGILFFNPTGNPGMATGGSGDVLFGMICGLSHLGLNSLQTLKLSVYLHGLAGDLAESRFGELSMVAGDIIDHLPEAISQL
jgi:NAD(P)H-hydrate epimerase